MHAAAVHAAGTVPDPAQGARRAARACVPPSYWLFRAARVVLPTLPQQLRQAGRYVAMLVYDGLPDPDDRRLRTASSPRWPRNTR